MKQNRPVNLDIGSIKLPVTSYVSILHRVSGVALFFVAGLLLWMLDSSLSSAQGFASVADAITSPLGKLIAFLCLAALAYHLVAGVRHMIMDLGYGEELESGVAGAKIALVIAVVLIAVCGVWVLSW